MQRIILAILTFLIASGLLISCTPVNPTAPAGTPTDIAWQAPEGWWTRPQVQAFSSPLFESFAIEDYAHPPEYFLDLYAEAGVTLANWNDIRGIDTWREVFPQVVAELHARGMIVVGDIGLITSLWDQTSAQELQPAIMRDPYGNALETSPCNADNPCTMPILSVIHPAAQEYYLAVVKSYINSGVDGILVDELAYGSVFLPDFNENTMHAFRQYLMDTYTPEELAVLGQPFGITDFSTLDYAALVRSSLPADRTRISPEDWQWDLWGNLPFWLDYQRFLRYKNHEFALWLFEEGKTYALDTYGREMPFSANLGEITNSEALYLLDALDYVDLEYHYQSLGYFPNTSAVTSVRIAQAFGKRPYLVTGYWDTDPDIAARGPERSKNLFRTMIADAYGTGASFAVMEGLHGIQQDFSALTSYYRFPTDYPFLFDGMSPVNGQVGLLYLWEAKDTYSYKDLLGLGQMLADCGYQFNIIFGAEEHTWWSRPQYIVPAPDHPLTLDMLTPNSLIVVPQLDDITPRHAELLLQYVKLGGKVLLFATPELIGNIEGERAQDNPAVQELLGYIRAGESQVDQGRIIAVEELLGKPYATHPQPEMRQALLDLLTAENILPEVSMSPAKYVGAFMHQGEDSLTIHFVNYDYDPDSDATTPAGPLQVELSLPDGFVSTDPLIHLYSPDAPMQTLRGNSTGNKLSLTLPEFDVWSVLWIGSQESIQAAIAAHPTSTPLPTATSKPSLEPGSVIYDDELAEGWQASGTSAEIDLESANFIAQGSLAIETDAQEWGALILKYQDFIDTADQDWLVFQLNPGEIENPDGLSVTIFSQGRNLTYVYIGGYLDQGRLRRNEWSQVVIPLSALNPSGVPFDTFYFETETPGAFYLDDIRLVNAPT